MTELELATLLVPLTLAEIDAIMPQLVAEGALWFTTSDGVSTFIFADRAASATFGPTEAAKVWAAGYLYNFAGRSDLGSIDLQMQKAIRDLLVGRPALMALVPAQNILDSNQRPAPSPSIILGDSQEVDEGTSLKRRHTRVFHTLHVWKKEPSLQGVKLICSEIRNALTGGRPLLGWLHCADLRVSGVRFLRDPGGEMSHGVVSIEALVTEGRT